MTEHLIVFAKNPVLGNVKTRLAKDIGHDKALSIYEDLLGYTLKVANQFRGERHLYFDEIPVKYKGLPNTNSQEGTDLGEKLSNALSTFKEARVVIGSDCPDIDVMIIHRALDELKNSDLVIGPAMDGGFYLLACNSFVSELFEDILWSSDSVFEKLCQNADSLGFTYTILEKLRDVDTLDDLESVMTELNNKVA